MKLSKLEQESIILYNEEESTASIYTHDPKLKRKLKRLAEKYPDKVYPDIHRLLHATKEETIKAYLSQLQLTYKQKAKLNKLRQLANMQAI